MEQSVFVKTLGEYPLIKILDFLMEARNFDYPLTEIAENAGVNFVTLKKLWGSLEKKGFVIHTRNIGRARLYKINEKNEVVKRLMELDAFLCAQAIRNMQKKEKSMKVTC